jgi:hypothetical protein
VAAFLLLSAAPGAAQQAPPGGCAAGAICESSDPPYPFFSARDEIALAMQTLWLSQFQSHSDPAAAGSAMQERAEAEAVVLAGRDVAAAYLVETLRMLSPEDDGGYASLSGLLQLVGDSPAILGHLFEVASAPPPEPIADSSGQHGPIPGHRIVRAQAVSLIAQAAGLGSDLARSQLLELLRALDPQVRSGAVRAYLGIRRSRAQAHREMRRMLDVADHHLLYRY